LVLATKRAVEQVRVPYTEIIIDGTINFLRDTTKGQYVTTLPKADLLIPSVSAASIIAKVARDAYMAAQDAVYPGYKFASHVGYGTAAHRAAIAQLGVTPLHRLSFAPLQKYRVEGGIWNMEDGTRKAGDQPIESLSSDSQIPTSKSIGDAGETAAANYLVRHGHEIIDRNWRTKYCEIDIISTYKDVLFFTEVKYRKTALQGGGMAAITRKKQNQMAFAAKFYVQANKITNTDLRLAAIDVTGTPPEVQEYLELG
ncbi:MAG: YraN family protein, partial [Candidatus Saccharimonadales bacterium]